MEEANRIVTSETYDRGAVLDFFREQFPTWPYEEYVELFRIAWESNRAFADDRGPMRFVGLNPCVDWEVVNYSEEEAAVKRELDRRDRYDEVMASSLERHLLEPGRPDLVFTGVAHSTTKFVEFRFGTEEQLPRMGNMINRKPWAGQMFFVALHAPFWDAGTEKDIYPFDGILERLMLKRRAAIGFDVVGSPFQDLVHETKSARAITAYRFGELYDGYIMHDTPSKQAMGVTCIPDWIENE